jgi:hypothetical protein
MLVRIIFSGQGKADTRQAEFEKRREAVRAKVPHADRWASPILLHPPG